MSDFDINNVTASVINQQLTDLTTRLTGDVKRQWQKHFTSFKAYLSEACDKYSQTKTLLYKDKAVPLSKIYVGTRLAPLSRPKNYSEADIVKKLAAGDKLLISATAGSGKSFFARYLFLALLASKKKIPILIELRNLNDSGRSIIQQVQFELRSSDITVPESIIFYWLKSGQFTLILDGYDELTKGQLNQINSEIKDLSAELGESSLLVTSRPSDQLEYLTDFEVFQVLPLSKTQAIELVERLDYDKKVKELFLNHLKTGIFEQHRDFLSNPLLLTIMLMTYGDIAEIPSKMHVFYEQAFDVLFFRHDASKGMYTRDILSGLALDDFKEVLSSVSASGYIRSKVSLSNSELLSFIRKAKKTTGITTLSPEKFKQDLLQSVCILVNDGNKYTYNHRSFQEYFAALFLVTCSIDDKFALYTRFLARATWDNALSLAFEMQRRTVETEFIEPYLAQYRDLIEKDQTLEILKLWVRKFRFQWIGREKGGQPHFGVEEPTEFFDFCFLVEKVYSNIAGSNRLRTGNLLTKKAFLREIGPTETPVLVDVQDLSPGHEDLLENLGILEHVRRRVRFLKWVCEHLDCRRELTSENDIEDWL